MVLIGFSNCVDEPLGHVVRVWMEGIGQGAVTKTLICGGYSAVL